MVVYLSYSFIPLQKVSERCRSLSWKPATAHWKYRNGAERAEQIFGACATKFPSAVISHICHKSEERCECLKESSKQQCEVFLPASGGFWLAEGILGHLSLLSLTEAGNRFFDINASSTERTLNTFIYFSWAGLGKFIGCINQGQCQN